MPKLKTMNSIPTFKSRLQIDSSDKAAYYKLRDERINWRKWYNSNKWRKLRMLVLKESLFTCAMCNKIEHDTSKLVADHIQPHKGNEGLFWQRHNLQCLCKHCHDSIKQREEKQGYY